MLPTLQGEANTRVTGYDTTWNNRLHMFVEPHRWHITPGDRCFESDTLPRMTRRLREPSSVPHEPLDAAAAAIYEEFQESLFRLRPSPPIPPDPPRHNGLTWLERLPQEERIRVINRQIEEFNLYAFGRRDI